MLTSGTTVKDARREICPVVLNEDPYHKDFLPLLNRARQALIDTGKWKGTVLDIVFDAANGFITLPPCLSGILSVTVDGCPAVVFTDYYRYAFTGYHSLRGLQPRDGILVDLGDRYITSVDHLAGQGLRFRLSSSDDLGSKIRVFGKDDNGNVIRDAQGFDGLEIELDAAVVDFPFDVNEFTGFQKDQTNGTLSVYSYDGVTETLLQVYEPQETRPLYKRYEIGTSTRTQRIGALCKLRYTPVVADSDFVIPENITSLMLGIQAIQHFQAHNYGEGSAALNTAVSILNKEYESLKGAALPIVNTISVFNASQLHVN